MTIKFKWWHFPLLLIMAGSAWVVDHKIATTIALLVIGGLLYFADLLMALVEYLR